MLPENLFLLKANKEKFASPVRFTSSCHFLLYLCRVHRV